MAPHRRCHEDYAWTAPELKPGSADSVATVDAKRSRIDVAQAAVEFRIEHRRPRKTRPRRAACEQASLQEHARLRPRKYAGRRRGLRQKRSRGETSGEHAEASSFLRCRSFIANEMHHVCFGSIDQAGPWMICAKARYWAAFVPHAACSAARLILVKMPAENRLWLERNISRERLREDS